jgi:hypothetical protein
MITQKRLKELFKYNTDTGDFIRAMKLPGGVVGSVAGCLKSGYVVIRADGVLYRAHRLAWLYINGEWPIGEVDHINGQKNDNRISNLRDVPISENRQNQRTARKNNTTGFLGVTYSKVRNKFIAHICINGKNKTIGYFENASDAHTAYVSEKRINHKGNTL